MRALGQPAALTTALDVAQAVWQAVNDASARLRYAAGADVVALVGQNAACAGMIGDCDVAS